MQQPVYIQQPPIIQTKEIQVPVPVQVPVMVSSPRVGYKSRVATTPERQQPFRTPVKKEYVPPKVYKKPVVFNVPTEEEEIEEITEITEVTRQVKAVSMDERPEAVVQSADHWHDYEVTRADIDDNAVNKLDMNDAGNRLYATGLNGTKVIDVQDGMPVGADPVRPEKRGSDLKCVQAGHVVLMEPSTNDAYLVDQNLGEKKRLDGLAESGVGKI